MEALKFHGIALALALSFLAVLLLFLFSLGRPNEICYSKGGRFPPYRLDGKAPEKASDLTFCRIFSGKTCCNSEQTHSTLLTAGKIAFECKSDYECVNLWQFLECSICDPKIGVQRGAPLNCSSFCDRIFRAFPDAYFARDGPDLKPCGSQSLVCAKVSSLFSNGTELCNAAGFSVPPDDPGKPEQSEKYCYGSEVVDSYNNPWQSSQKWKPEKSEQTEETIGKTFYEDAPSRVTKSKASAEDTPSRGTKGKASTEDTPSRVTKSEASSEDTPSRVRKSEASTEDTASRLEKSMVLRKHVLYQAWKFFHDSIVYCTLGLAGLAAWLFFLRFMKGDPSIEKAKSCLSSINKTDAKPKKKNRRSQKKKNG